MPPRSLLDTGLYARGSTKQVHRTTSAYKNFKDEDLAAIFAYLQSLPPVRNRVPEPVPPGM